MHGTLSALQQQGAEARLRLACRWFGGMAPRLLGRWAAAQFDATRPTRDRPRDIPPLGAQRFALDGAGGVTHGWLWPQDGPAALLVHGWGTDSRSMLGLVRPLQQLGLKVAVFDAPAHGVWPGRTTTMTDFTATTAAALRALGDVAVVAAHSAGAIAAIAALADQCAVRRQLHALVLLAPACSLPLLLEQWAAAGHALPRPVVEAVYSELQRRNGVPVSHWDAASLGRGLSTPALVLHDPCDPVVPYLHAARLVDHLPMARLSMMPAAGHAGVLHSSDTRRQVASFVREQLHGRAAGGPSIGMPGPPRAACPALPAQP